MSKTESRLQGKSRRKARIRSHTLLLLGVGCLFSAVALLTGPLDSVNLWLSDQLFISETVPPNIVIAGIDDDTLAEYGRWSEWPRSLHAQAIDNLSTAGAKVIGFDVLFVDDSADDGILAEAMQNAGNVVLAVAGVGPVLESERKLTYANVLMPTAPLKEASRGTGHVNFEPDHDGKVRCVPLVVRDGLGADIPSFNLAVLHAHFSMPLPTDYMIRNGCISVLARNVPVDAYSRLRINFSGALARQPYVSYGDIIRGEFDLGMVRNKIVLVGMTATGDLDAWYVPISAGKVPGVFVHAAAMDTVLRQQFLDKAGPEVTLLSLVLMLGVCAVALPRLRLRWSLALLGGLFIVYLALSFLSFDRGYLLNMLYPLSLLPIAFAVSITYQITAAQSDKQFVRDLFGRYVSPQVAREILNSADAGQLRLGGETRDVTVLFADIRNYTVISEKLSPEATVEMLNRHLSVIIDRVLQNGGMVNKFAGDNIMAVWNAPESQPEHARLAVTAAWEALQVLAAMPHDPSLPPVLFGIGINSGQALAGNVGSLGRAEYTVIGDTVNLASRICSGTPGGEAMIGPETYRQAREYIEAEELPPQAFKGKSERVIVYRVKGLK